VYPVLRLHDLARERQRELLQLAVRKAPRAISEEPGALTRLLTPFERARAGKVASRRLQREQRQARRVT
jgi:hypothetical protein